MKNVIGAGFSGDFVSAFCCCGKLGVIPFWAFVELEVEIMYFFDGGGGDLGMLGETGVEGCCAAFLSANDDEMWGIWGWFHSC